MPSPRTLLPRSPTLVIVFTLAALAAACSLGQTAPTPPELRAARDIDVLRSAARLYENDHPGSLPQCPALFRDGVLSKQRSCIDPWKHPYFIERTGSGLVPRSAGRDGIFHTADDIASP